MAMVGLDQLRPGMVLAADILSPQGRRLALKGEQVHERHLRVCKVWGVTEADVEDPVCAPEDPADADVGGAVLERARERAKAFFSQSDSSLEVVRELREAYACRLARGMAQASGAKGEAPSGASQAGAAAPALDAEVQDIVRREVTLASLPDVFYRIVEALKSPRSSASYVAEVIGQDMSLSAKLLRMVNSPFYGFPNRIDTLPRAVAILAANQLTNLAMGVSVITMFKDVPTDLLDMRSFWRHSIGCGVIARMLARSAGGTEVERVFVSGLLHDVGRLVMLRNYPAQAAAVLVQARDEGRPLHQVEREVWGFSHGTLAGLLLKAWRLPLQLQDNVGLHHAPGRAREPMEPSVLHVADIMAHALMLGRSGTPTAPRLDPKAWKRLELSPRSVDHLAKVADGHVEDLERAFFTDHG